MASTIKVTHIYAKDGKSHFEDLHIETKSAAFAPPSPPLDQTAWFSAKKCQVVVQPPGWVGEWHCAPARLLFCVLAGGFGVEVSNGERREFPAGDLVLVNDKPGQGHRSWASGNAPLVTAVIELADDALLK
jgi:hypothetical protein